MEHPSALEDAAEMFGRYWDAPVEEGEHNPSSYSREGSAPHHRIRYLRMLPSTRGTNMERREYLTLSNMSETVRIITRRDEEKTTYLWRANGRELARRLDMARLPERRGPVSLTYDSVEDAIMAARRFFGVEPLTAHLDEAHQA